MKTKVCTKCGEEKPATKEFFHQRLRNLDGLNFQCKVCMNKVRKKWREKNLDRARAIDRKCYYKTRERHRGRHKKMRQQMSAAVYAIINKKTNIMYVGSTTVCRERWRKHRSQLKLGRHENPRLQQDYNETGLDNFDFVVLEEYPCDTTRAAVLKKEKEQIKHLLTEGKKLYNYFEVENGKFKKKDGS